MSSRDLIVEWSSADFLHDATVWVDALLASHDLTRTGPLQPHKVRFWSAVYQVPTDAGPFWFKACTPPLGHEPALTAAIADVAPHLVLTPLGIDSERHWMLSPDGGPTLRDTLTDAPDAQAHGLQQAVVIAASMQHDLIPHRELLLSAGIPALEAADAEAYFRSEVERLAQLPTEHPAHVSPAEAHNLLDRWARVAPAFELLSASPIPSTLQHNDLHDGNIFSPHRTGHFSVFDLGDAVWSHPFAILQVPRVIMAALPGLPQAPGGLDLTHPRVAHLFEAYLHRWSTYGSPQDLLAEACAADHLAVLHHYRTWAETLHVVDHPAMAARFAFVPRLGDLLGRVVAEDARSV